MLSILLIMIGFSASVKMMSVVKRKIIRNVFMVFSFKNIRDILVRVERKIRTKSKRCRSSSHTQPIIWPHSTLTTSCFEFFLLNCARVCVWDVVSHFPNRFGKIVTRLLQSYLLFVLTTFLVHSVFIFIPSVSSASSFFWLDRSSSTICICNFSSS